MGFGGNNRVLPRGREWPTKGRTVRYRRPNGIDLVRHKNNVSFCDEVEFKKETKKRPGAHTCLAIFLCTKMSPGLQAVISDSGTIESERPIQSTCAKKKQNEILSITSAFPAPTAVLNFRNKIK